MPMLNTSRTTWKVLGFGLTPSILRLSPEQLTTRIIFSDWIALHGERGDLLIALSGSGTSRNIVNAIKAAELLGMETHLETDYLRSMDMQESEEKQLEVGHGVMKCLRS